jgi:hypothetical protein
MLTVPSGEFLISLRVESISGSTDGRALRGALSVRRRRSPCQCKRQQKVQFNRTHRSVSRALNSETEHRVAADVKGALPGRRIACRGPVRAARRARRCNKPVPIVCEPAAAPGRAPVGRAAITSHNRNHSLRVYRPRACPQFGVHPAPPA